MKFEHLIQINDPLNPLIDPLTREQLWRGLVRYVEMPTAFVEGLDRGDILACDGKSMRRELWFGRHRVEDRVSLEPMSKIHIATRASPEIPAGALTLTIEAHGEDLLYVRFLYETFPQGHPTATAEFQLAIKQAYKEAGIDIIRRIRQLAEEGALDGPAH
jgi:hypothetical protein